jgi:ABC-type cobalamin/Fe3+-siderophores transport system ATPase subunit
MKIKHLWINTYKNIKDQNIEFQATNSSVYVLVGKNGSGKSNILEAISFIFSSLYKNPNTPEFAYELSYEIYGKTIEIEWLLELTIKVNGETVRYDYLINNSLLPNRVITVYSGEELRMWESIYKPFYDSFISGLINGAISSSSLSLMYINKYYWNISLLSLALSETHSCKEFLDNLDYEIKTIDFSYNRRNISANKEPKLATLFTYLAQKNRYSVSELRSLLKEVIYGPKSDYLQLNDFDIFEYFLKANIPKDFKTIEDISINFNNEFTVKDLSEGEKKKILIFTVMQVLAAENSIVLFDEPDSFLHPSWQKSLAKYIDSLSGENFVLMTTHSPNVLSGTDSENVIRINEGHVISNTPPTWGRDISSIQAEIMGEHYRDNEAENEIRGIYDLINRGDIDIAEVAVNKLAKEKMGPNDNEIIKIKTMIDFEREFR